MSIAPQSAEPVVEVDPPEHEWLGKQTASDAETAEEMATYQVRSLLAKQS